MTHPRAACLTSSWTARTARDLQEMESNAKKKKKRRLIQEEVDYESGAEPGEPCCALELQEVE